MNLFVLDENTGQTLFSDAHRMKIFGNAPKADVNELHKQMDERKQ